MDRVARHYEQLLARHYSWMIGMTFQAKVFSMLEAARDIVNRVLGFEVESSGAAEAAILSGSKNSRFIVPMLMYQHSRSAAFGPGV